jgi:hypothetical protein
MHESLTTDRNDSSLVMKERGIKDGLAKLHNQMASLTPGIHFISLLQSKIYNLVLLGESFQNEYIQLQGNRPSCRANFRLKS